MAARAHLATVAACRRSTGSAADGVARCRCSRGMPHPASATGRAAAGPDGPRPVIVSMATGMETSVAAAAPPPAPPVPPEALAIAERHADSSASHTYIVPVLMYHRITCAPARRTATRACGSVRTSSTGRCACRGPAAGTPSPARQLADALRPDGPCRGASGSWWCSMTGTVTATTRRIRSSSGTASRACSRSWWAASTSGGRP